MNADAGTVFVGTSGTTIDFGPVLKTVSVTVQAGTHLVFGPVALNTRRIRADDSLAGIRGAPVFALLRLQGSWRFTMVPGVQGVSEPAMVSVLD